MSRIGKSEAQANAEALARREAMYSPEHRVSVTVAHDYRRREPRDLRDAVDILRRAYADEVPSKLHEGPDSIGEGGTPKMTARAEAYMFGRADADDAPKKGEQPFIAYYQSPFRAQLAAMIGSHDRTFHECQSASHKRGLIVRHIAIGGQGPQQAAIAEGVPLWAAKLVAEDAVRSFLRGLSDMKVLPHGDIGLAEGTTAA